MKQCVAALMVAGAMAGAAMVLRHHPALALFLALTPAAITLIRAIREWV